MPEEEDNTQKEALTVSHEDAKDETNDGNSGRSNSHAAGRRWNNSSSNSLVGSKGTGKGKKTCKHIDNVGARCARSIKIFASNINALTETAQKNISKHASRGIVWGTQ